MIAVQADLGGIGAEVTRLAFACARLDEIVR
jgi:hypothetical protein